MATGDQYQFDIGSVRTLIQYWEQGSKDAGVISRRLAGIRDQLERSAAGPLREGPLGELRLAECCAALARAAAAANAVSGGLAQDTSKLGANLAAYVSAEAAAEARLKAVKQVGPVKAPRPTSGSASGSAGGSSSPQAGGSDPGGNTLQPPGPPDYANQAQVGSWIKQAFAVLEADGVPASELDEAGVLMIIEHESSGNPNAINNWDSNAKAGDPSRGLMQVIGATFNAYRLPGHGDIYSPVDNIIAGVRYALSRYGSISNVPGVRSVDNGGQYVGY
jgi:soluble lytic murein transglycosylase-like protein